MKKGMGVSFCCVMLLTWLFSFTCVTAEEYPVVLGVIVNDNGSVQITYDVKDSTKVCCWLIHIYQKGDIIDLSLPKSAWESSITCFDHSFPGDMIYPGQKWNRRSYQNIKSWMKFRTDVLTDGPNSPLKPGEYFAVAISNEEADRFDHFLSEPVPFTMGEWERSLRVEQEENGSFAFETKGFFSGCSSVRVYRQGTECDPTTEADEGIVICWPIDFKVESRKTYPENCGFDVGYGDMSALQGGKRANPLKSGSYYAIVVDEKNGKTMTEPVPFEVSDKTEPSPEPTATANPTSTPVPMKTSPVSPTPTTSQSNNGPLYWYIGIGAGVLLFVVGMVMIALRHSKKKK